MTTRAATKIESCLHYSFEEGFLPRFVHVREISEASTKKEVLQWHDNDNNRTTSFFIHVLGIGLKLYIKRVYFLL